jgi:hypothetical protein
VYSPTKTSALVSCVLRYTPILIIGIYLPRPPDGPFSRSRDWASHACRCGTQERCLWAWGVSSSGPFFCSLPVFPRLSARVVLLFSPRFCTSANASAPMDLNELILLSILVSVVLDCDVLTRDHASCSRKYAPPVGKPLVIGAQTYLDWRLFLDVGVSLQACRCWCDLSRRFPPTTASFQRCRGE